MARTMTTRIILSLYLACMSIAVNAQKQWTLDECIAYATRNDLTLKRSDVAIRTQEETYKKASKSWMPTVNADLSAMLNFGMSLDLLLRQSFVYAPAVVTAELPIDISGGRRFAKKAEEMQLKSLEEARNKAEKDISMKIAMEYLQLLYAKSQYRIVETERKLASERVEMVRTLVDGGSRSEGELTEANSSLTEAEYNCLEAMHHIASARLALAQTIMLNDTADFDIADIAESNTMACDSNNVNNNAAIRQLTMKMEADKYRLKEAKSELYPKLSLTGALGIFGYSALKSGESYEDYKKFWKNHNEVIALKMSIPIFNAYTTRGKIRQATLAVRDTQLAIDEEKKNLSDEIAQLQLAISQYDGQLAKLQTLSAQREQAYEYQKTRYEGGLATWLELIEADSRLHEARLQSEQTRMKLNMSRQILALYFGSRGS